MKMKWKTSKCWFLDFKLLSSTIQLYWICISSISSGIGIFNFMSQFHFGKSVINIINLNKRCNFYFRVKWGKFLPIRNRKNCNISINLRTINQPPANNSKNVPFERIVLFQIVSIHAEKSFFRRTSIRSSLDWPFILFRLMHNYSF